MLEAIQPTDDGPTVRIKFAAVVTRLNQLEDGSDGQQGQQGPRGIEGPPGSAVASRRRPGDGPSAFTDSLLGGSAELLPGLVPDIVTTATATAQAARNGGVIAQRMFTAIEPGHVYRARYVVQRTIDPVDPEGDAVRIAIKWFDAARQPILGVADSIVEDLFGFTYASGRSELSVFLARSPGPGIDLITPATARYARAYVKAFGTDQATGVEVLEIDDVTDFLSVLVAKLVDPDTVPALNVRTSALEARQIFAQGLASGGGDLTADRTFTVNKATQVQAEAGTLDTVALTPLTGRYLVNGVLFGATLQAPAPDWSGLDDHSHDGVRADIGTISDSFHPGLNRGSTSALTGAVRVALAAAGNTDLTANAGLTGLAISDAPLIPAMGGHFRAGANVAQAHVFGSQSVAVNGLGGSGDTVWSGVDAVLRVTEDVLILKTPSAGWSNTHALGHNVVLAGDSQPDGTLTAYSLTRASAAAWKVGYTTDPGSTEYFARVSQALQSGPCSSQTMSWVSRDGASADRWAFMALLGSGEMVIQPDFYSGGNNLIVGNSDLSSTVAIHPVLGVRTPALTTNTMSVNVDGSGPKGVFYADLGTSGVRYLAVAV